MSLELSGDLVVGGVWRDESDEFLYNQRVTGTVCIYLATIAEHMNKNLMTMILTRIKPDRILYSLQAVKLQEPILIIPDEGS